ncbi:hypothetical protein G5V57_31490 [Nordella sp. HKS 07]|uniref:hypothetical protein n=1 Tax=Nordella sp. HKS 07 TaxID=2712222 RepID=UPI0013E1C6BF|nr:hypothetical protein [Nordella sp. HKS 07]QIG51834.1 hypothetical protein G5V57_31490 [Nordella sp. HKS 07]
MKLQRQIPQSPLRNGDIVEVRSASEIVGTLDVLGTVDGMPFMPEMASYVGQRFRVSRRVEKICDTIAATGSRRMRDTLYLEDLRCNGSQHGGCQAGCRIYWKEEWLRRVDGFDKPSGTRGNPEKLQTIAERGTRPGEKQGDTQIWRCQATEAFRASEPLKTSDLRQYWREMTNGNFNPVRLTGILIRGLFMELASRFGWLRPTPFRGPGKQQGSSCDLEQVRPGDLVRVRTPAEIAATLDGEGLNRGLSFDREMLPFCGRVLRVKDKVRRIIDDKTGRMLTIPKDCVILEGAVCSGERSVGRWLCPREIHAYWRESWLQKAEKAD